MKVAWKKTILVCFVMIFLIMSVLGISILTKASVSGQKYLSIATLRERDGERIGYRLKTNSRIIWKIQEHASLDENIPPLTEQPAIYCLRGGLGFRESGTIYKYDIAFDMLTEKDEIEAQNEVLYNLVNSGKYNKILALLSYMYTPGGASETYKERLLEEVKKEYPEEYTTTIKDTDIEVLNQAVLWSLTNSEDSLYTNNYEATDWLEYTTDGTNYYSLSNYKLETQEGAERAKQIDSLYKWLSDKAENYFLSGEIVEQICEVISEDGCDLKANPNASAESISVLPEGTQITKIRDNVAYINGIRWSLVRLEDGTEGYINNDLCKVIIYNEKCQVSTPSGVKVREEATTASTQVGSAQNGTFITRLERSVATANGYTWDKIRLEDGTEGYVANRFITLIPNEIYDEGFKGIGEPITVDKESALEYEIENSNYIVGPINITKNNDLLYDIDFSVNVGETNVTDYKVLNSEKEEISKDEITEGSYYLSIPIVGTKTISIDANVNYESTELTLWATTENDKAQPVVFVSKEDKTITSEFEVEPDLTLNVEEQEITKTGTENVTSRNDKVEYKVNYTAKVDTYVGNAKVRLVDTLPYSINESESNLDGGIYNAENKTITWEIDLGEINTFKEENGKCNISVEKNVSLLYEDIDLLEEKMTNKVNGELILETEDEIPEVTDEYDTLINVDGIVEVKYKDKYSDEEIDEKVVHTGRIGNDFDVTDDQKEIEGYTFIEGPEEKNGKYEESAQEKIYYYAKNTQVIVKYLEKDDTPENNEDNKLLAESITIPGYEGKEYTTDKKEIEDYTFAEDTENTSGKMQKDPITVIYYYAQTTKIIVNYIDKTTNEKITVIIEPGKVGDLFTSEAKDFENYVLVEKPENETVTATKDVIELNYYYAHVSSGVIEKHIDIETNTILDSKTYEGNEGDPYNTEEKEFKEYTIVTNEHYYKKYAVEHPEFLKENDVETVEELLQKLGKNAKDSYIPDNSNGNMQKDVIEVIYYYRLSAEVLDDTITKKSDDVLNKRTDKIEYTIKYNAKINSYEGKAKTIIVDTLEYPINEAESVLDGGIYNSENKTITWEIDLGEINTYKTGENVAHEVNIEKTISLLYKDVDISKEKIINEVKATTNLIDAKVSKETQAVEDVDINVKGNVIVRYVNKTTNNNIIEPITLDGQVGSTYKTDKKEFEHYKFVESTENTSGKIKEEQIEVIYYYILEGEIVDNNITKESNDTLNERTDKITYNISYNSKINYYQGKAKTIIVDKLEYPINEAESSLDGGTYNAENKTITWEVNSENIDTIETGENIAYEINIEKTIVLLYKDVDVSKDIITNKIEATVLLINSDKSAKTENTENIDINVKGNVNVLYKDKTTNNEISDKVEKTGKIGTKFDVSEDKKNIDGYTLIEEPTQKVGIFEEETQEKVYWYAKNTKVIVNYIDKTTNKMLDKVEENGYVGKSYTSETKDFENYVLVQKPKEETVVMTEDVIELNYYYIHISSGVIEKHLDITSNKLLDNTLYEGNEGDSYATTSKEFEGYDIVTNERYYTKYVEEHPEFLKDNEVETVKELLEKLEKVADEPYIPENAEGNMTIDVIEVKYYYIRKSSVKVQYIDKITNKTLLDEEKNDSTEIINGYETDPYKTEEKTFKDYVIVKEMYPENVEGKMEKEQIVVKYYYVHVSAGVIEKHIDEITGEVIEPETKYEGNEGDEYKTTSKIFEGYDLVENKLPENAEGTMTKEEIVVEYYYIRKAEVIVEHIDKITKKIILGKDAKDSTEYIYGYENDTYKTQEKSFENYEIVKEMYPENADGKMAITKNADGTIDNVTYVKYYYVHTSSGVVEKHIDMATGELLERETKYEGNEGDSYSTTSKEFTGYDIVKERLPKNAKGTMTKEEIVVNYYYSRKVNLIVEHYEEGTNRKLAEDERKVVHEGEHYSTSSKDIMGYNVISNKIPENKDGTVEQDDIIVKYYYEKKQEQQPATTTIIMPNTTVSSVTPKQDPNPVVVSTPKTGDNLPIIAIAIIIFVIAINGIQIIISKKNKKTNK